MSATTIERPNGKVYRPRAEPRAVLLGYEDDDPDTVIVMGTHDVQEAQSFAERAVEEYERDFYGKDSDYTITMTNPEKTWYRRVLHGFMDGDVACRYLVDPERGSATVRWTLTIAENDR